MVSFHVIIIYNLDAINLAYYTIMSRAETALRYIKIIIKSLSSGTKTVMCFFLESLHKIFAESKVRLIQGERKTNNFFTTCRWLFDLVFTLNFSTQAGSGNKLILRRLDKILM